jgi:hypothetical protein
MTRVSAQVYSADMDDEVNEQPVLMVPVRTLIEQALADDDVKHLAGEVRSFDELMKPESLRLLADQSPGILAYLAFHPVADAPVAEYIKNGSLASDSGRRILVLFTTDKSDFTLGFEAGSALSIPGVTVESGIHPSYEMIRLLFEPDPSPPLPGIAFFKSFAAGSEAVYVSMADLENPLEVTKRMRAVFSLVTEVGYPAPAEKFADRVSTALQKQRLPYARSGSKSLAEWFVRGYQFIYDHSSDIVAVAGLFT